MAPQRRMNLWASDGSVMSLPDEWCLTSERGWMRVDDVASMIREVAESSDMEVEAYEEVFQLAITDGVAEQYSVGDISEDAAQAMIASIEGFFIRQ